MIGDSVTCPQCGGKGKVVISEKNAIDFLERVFRSGRLREMSNEKIADSFRELENFLRDRDLPSIVFEVIDEAWWRLHAADEPIAETQRKIEAKRNDPVWLAGPNANDTPSGATP